MNNAPVQTVPASAQQVVFVQTPAPSLIADRLKLSVSGFRGTGITQIVAGGLCMITQIIGMVSWTAYSHVGTGIWCGVLFTGTGSLGVAASYSQTKCSVVAYLVLSIISAIFIMPILVTSSLGLAFIGVYPYYLQYIFAKWTAVLALLLSISLVEGIAAIVGSAYCCMALSATPTAVTVPQNVQCMPSTAYVTGVPVQQVGLQGCQNMHCAGPYGQMDMNSAQMQPEGVQSQPDSYAQQYQYRDGGKGVPLK